MISYNFGQINKQDAHACANKRLGRENQHHFMVKKTTLRQKANKTLPIKYMYKVDSAFIC